ncbi:LysR substrate-binding domain-containing protein [soil metagenome]
MAARMNLNRIDLVSLSLFSLVVRTGSISRGAELSQLALGAASKRIADLEAALGVVLLTRHSRGVTPTVAGTALDEHARRVLGDIEHLAADLSDYAQGLAGIVRLWANTSSITQFLPAELAAFAGAHPDLRIELEESDSPETVLAVLDGRADLGIVADRIPLLGLAMIPYRSDRLVLLVPADHPLAAAPSTRFETALDYDFVTLLRSTSLTRRLQGEADVLGKRLKVRIQVRSFEAMCHMVAAGLGIAVLPVDAIRAQLQTMAIRKIDLADGWSQRALLLVMRDAAALARPARSLLDHLVAPVPIGAAQR